MHPVAEIFLARAFSSSGVPQNPSVRYGKLWQVYGNIFPRSRREQPALDHGSERLEQRYSGKRIRALPEEAFAKISRVMEEVVTSPEFAAGALKLKTVTHWMPSAAFKALYERELDEYGKIIREVIPAKK